jgi:hypothetical protein
MGSRRFWKTVKPKKLKQEIKQWQKNSL